MNAKKLFLGLLTATVVIIPFATSKPASASNNVSNSTFTPVHGLTGMLLMAKGKGKAHTSNARPSTQEKHQKGQANKQNAQDNKLFQEAKKSSKYKNLSKDTIMKIIEEKNKQKK
jgi:hypothetical protein